MNYKLEKFWNLQDYLWKGYWKYMNYKLEKFWNSFNISTNDDILYEL